MLLLAGILLTIIGLGILMLIGGANMMSDAPGTSVKLWPAWAILLLAIACFVARHYLHGKVITW